eukprot:6202914-Pleurochrysis_carterae.AAC.4
MREMIHRSPFSWPRHSSVGDSVPNLCQTAPRRRPNRVTVGLPVRTAMSPSLLVMVPTTLLVSMMINAYVLLVGVCFADIYRRLTLQTPLACM